jgi:hypothetical protein
MLLQVIFSGWPRTFFPERSGPTAIPKLSVRGA